MTDINTTSIIDLPTDSTVGGSIAGNISNIQQPINTNNNFSNTGTINLDQNTISQIISGIQQASLSGATTLPSRDIPQQTQQITNDPNIIPNYIPPPINQNYIPNNLDDINKYYTSEKMGKNMDIIYDEIQTPILLAILYFLFQLPIFKMTIFKYMSSLCKVDGNYNFTGLVFVSTLYGFLYYILNKIIGGFDKF